MNIQILKTKVSDGKQVAESSKKTSTMTFRLDEEIIEKLRAEFKNRHISSLYWINRIYLEELE